MEKVQREMERERDKRRLMRVTLRLVLPGARETRRKGVMEHRDAWAGRRAAASSYLTVARQHQRQKIRRYKLWN